MASSERRLPQRDSPNGMPRMTFRLPVAMFDEIEQNHVRGGHYPNRSEFVRAAIREKLQRERSDRDA